MKRKIIYQCAVSLDGYIEDHLRRFDWCLTDYDYGMQPFMNSIDTFLYGHTTYDLIVSMGEKFDPAKKHYIFGSHIEKIDPACEWVLGSAVDFVKSLLEKKGQDIWLMGGATLAGSLANEDLIDEIQLAVHPIVLGKGTPLFLGLEKRLAFFPYDYKPFSNGVSFAYYRRGNL